MPGSTRIKALLLKAETTFGTDSVPTAAANAVLLRNATITPLETETADRQIDGSSKGHMEDIPVSSRVLVEGEYELVGSGAAGTAPAWGLINRSCGMAEVITAATDVQYNPISSDYESASGY